MRPVHVVGKFTHGATVAAVEIKYNISKQPDKRASDTAGVKARQGNMTEDQRHEVAPDVGNLRCG